MITVIHRLNFPKILCLCDLKQAETNIKLSLVLPTHYLDFRICFTVKLPDRYLCSLALWYWWYKSFLYYIEKLFLKNRNSIDQGSLCVKYLSSWCYQERFLTWFCQKICNLMNMLVLISLWNLNREKRLMKSMIYLLTQENTLYYVTFKQPNTGKECEILLEHCVNQWV